MRIGTAIRAQRPSFVLLYNGEGAAAYHRGDEAKGEEFKRTAKVGAP